MSKKNKYRNKFIYKYIFIQLFASRALQQRKMKKQGTTKVTEIKINLRGLAKRLVVQEKAAQNKI